jgi:predicted DNA-binding transcriptional regulator AlpA
MHRQEIIRGWEALRLFTGLNEHLLRRAIGHYDFPEPMKLRDRSVVFNGWNSGDVLGWMASPDGSQYLNKYGVNRMNKTIGNGTPVQC